MRSVGAFEAKTHLAALLDAVSAGERITITRLRQFSQGQSLGGLTIAELRDQGRRCAPWNRPLTRRRPPSDLVLDVTPS